jgi:uncharacterized protein (DUF2235 family)/lipoprotein NlpI
MKRIALCLDGTWNDNRAVSPLTNVARLQHAIAGSDGNGVRQVSHYVDGIASTDGETAQFLKGAVGFGIGDRIRKAYELLAADYEPGDEIYLFGFSRGAFEARSLGALITLFGVAKAVGSFPFDKAWSLYRTRAAKRSETALAEVRAASHYPVRIKCVGVWDTVGNIGNPFSSSGPVGRMFKFHDTALSDSIDVGLHALSIDEIRGPFRPALWSLPEGQALPANQHVEQVWFAGTHCDVGGGFRETGLSDIALLWMAERVAATTGMALDMDELARTSRPDPLGAQHRSAAGSIFRWSRLFPFVRLVKQAVEGISPLRRALFGTWRTSKVRGGRTVVNESIHPSVVRRFGQKVIELRDGRSHAIDYRPANLVPVVPEQQAQAVPLASGEPRRVKIFTVHGTFAHDTDWDDWDAKDDEHKKPDDRRFINRLCQHLRQSGVMLEQLDHTQYNWSGGNSHDERRIAAIGLKKLIQEELSKVYERHGPDYYDKVFIVAHSHGGTISRLAMNMWDKDDAYYDPVKTAQLDELKHDDECPTCLRTRNGLVGRNSVRRPDGVITFGSPFVSFERRSGGLFTARLSAWVFRILMAVPLGAVLYAAHAFGASSVVSWLWQLTPGFMQSILLLVWPLALCWLAASYLPRLPDALERRFGKSTALFVLGTVIGSIRYLAYAATAALYFIYFGSQLDRVLQWLPLSNASFVTALAWAHLLTVVLFVLVAVPGSFLSWLKREVVGLRERLPVKYDPAEDRVVSYVSYHTPGDEAGLHLRIFGVLTWLVQTLALSAASVLAIGILVIAIVGVETALGLLQGGGLLNRLGISAVSDFPEFRDRFITLVDSLTYLPRLVWAKLLNSTWFPSLGGMESSRYVVWFIPFALVASVLLIFLFLMPFVILAVAVVYLVSIWLRGSGVVFGSEKLSWNLANRITVMRHPNTNASVRIMFISPEAWWRREIAHSYYYKSDRVIADVAERIANWGGQRPTPAWPIESVVGVTARAVVVALFVLSIFAVSVPIASAVATKMEGLAQVIGGLGTGPGSLPEPKDAEGYIARGNSFRKMRYFDRALADQSKGIAMAPNAATGYNDRGVTYQDKGEYELAMADYGKAIELDPKLALAYNNRAGVYRQKGDLDQAIAEYTKAVEVDPTYANGYSNRATTYEIKGDADRAIADFSKALELAPDNYSYLLSRGVAKYGKGDFKDAAADLGLSIEKRVYIYTMLFRYLAQARAGETTATAELEKNVGRLQSKDWPIAVAEFYLGKRTSAAMLGAAKTADERCEAQFYVGQWQVLKNELADAAKALQGAVDTCPKTFLEYRAARAELKRLGR